VAGARLEAARDSLRRGGALLLAGNTLRSVSDGIVAFGATLALAPRRARIRTIADALDVAYGFEYGPITIAPMQVRSEIEALLALLEQNPPSVVLELGTARGGTLFLLSHVAAADATLVSVDLPGGDFGGGYPAPWVPFLGSFARERQTIELIRADSHASSTLERIRELLSGREVDLLLIDGDHSPDGVRQDFQLYSPLVRAGGWIAFHDIVPGREDLGGGVPDFWKELKTHHSAREIVEDWTQGAYGIGLIAREDARQRPEPARTRSGRLDR
jgi:cephalosporin hydroxylase